MIIQIQASIVYSSHSYEKLSGLHIRINQQYSMTYRYMWSDTQIRRGGLADVVKLRMF